MSTKNNGKAVYGVKPTAQNRTPFQYGSIPPLAETTRQTSTTPPGVVEVREGGGGFATGPTGGGSPALQSLAALQGKAAEAAQRANNPLGTPGAQQTLQAIQTQMNTRQQQGLAAAKSRGAQTGQAGFQGALAQTARGLESDNRASYADASAQLGLTLSQAAMQQELAYSQAAAQAEAEQGRQSLQRYGIDSDLAAKREAMRSNERLSERNNLIEQAKLAEQGRQFERSATMDEEQFGQKLSQSNDQFDRTFSANEQERKDTTAYNTKLLNLKESESSFQRAKEILGLAAGAHDAGLLSKDGLSGKFDPLGIKLDRPGNPKEKEIDWRDPRSRQTVLPGQAVKKRV